jgi:hypothetical protein
MAPFSKLSIAFKALNQLGFRPVALNALYQLGLVTGHYRRTENREWGIENSDSRFEIRDLFDLPGQDELQKVLEKKGMEKLLADAEEIVAGKVRLFGGEAVPLRLTVPGELAHWTDYETSKAFIPYSLITELPVHDIKFLWEPARFGWTFTLGRAYHLTGDERYPQAFWHFIETFLDANPPYLGPNWTSGQEAAIRLMALAWAAQVFAAAPASTPERTRRLAESVAAHAARIPPTLVYARSQQNNHLLTEAAGLLTAGLALPDHPEASRWRSQGWKWLNRGLQEQIDTYGEYAQHSTNYHRLMLQVVLWTNALIRSNDLDRHYRWPRQTTDAITRSTHWLLAILDSDTGRTPNLGANDGAYIFPFAISPFPDYRPVLHASARAFLGYDLPRGPWDELSLWFRIPLENRKYVQLPRYLGDQLYGKDSWVFLRTAQFTTRPSHADQLHVDLWWRGLNVAQDAGTYLYNADSPWDNSLTTALVHNTITVNGRDQMRRVGRFLYLDWVNAYRKNVTIHDPSVIQCVRGRYRTPGFRHTRTVSVFEDNRWQVVDEILPLRFLLSFFRLHPSSFRLHWLLPDWEWKAEDRDQKVKIRLKSPYGSIMLTINHSPSTIPCTFSLARAGEILIGSAAPDPTRGWISPTYGVKVPALSLAVETKSANDVQFVSEFIFP